MKSLLTILAGIIVLILSGIYGFKSKPQPCGTYKGHNIYKGEKGGCFYMKTKKKIKVYIDKDNCNCD